MYNNEYTAINIKKELHDHTGKIQGNISKIKKVFGDLSQSNSLISEMQNRVKRNKITYYLICLFVLLLVFIIIYFKIF